MTTRLEYKQEKKKCRDVNLKKKPIKMQFLREKQSDQPSWLGCDRQL